MQEGHPATTVVGLSAASSLFGVAASEGDGDRAGEKDPAPPRRTRTAAMLPAKLAACGQAAPIWPRPQASTAAITPAPGGTHFPQANMALSIPPLFSLLSIPPPGSAFLFSLLSIPPLSRRPCPAMQQVAMDTEHPHSGGAVPRG